MSFQMGIPVGDFMVTRLLLQAGEALPIPKNEEVYPLIVGLGKVKVGNQMAVQGMTLPIDKDCEVEAMENSVLYTVEYVAQS